MRDPLSIHCPTCGAEPSQICEKVVPVAAGEFIDIREGVTVHRARAEKLAQDAASLDAAEREGETDGKQQPGVTVRAGEVTEEPRPAAPLIAPTDPAAEEAAQASSLLPDYVEHFGEFKGGKGLKMKDGRELLLVEFETTYVIVFSAPTAGGLPYRTQVNVSREGMHALYMLYYLTAISAGRFERDSQAFDEHLDPALHAMIKEILEPLAEQLVSSLEGFAARLANADTLELTWTPYEGAAYYVVEANGQHYRSQRLDGYFLPVETAAGQPLELIVRAYDDAGGLVAKSGTATISFNPQAGQLVGRLAEPADLRPARLDAVARQPDAEELPRVGVAVAAVRAYLVAPGDAESVLRLVLGGNTRDESLEEACKAAEAAGDSDALAVLSTLRELTGEERGQVLARRSDRTA